MRRVAVTGFGVISPAGCGREAYWSALAEGQSGIGPITRFDCSTFDVRLAGEVKEPIELPEPVAQVAAEDPKVGFAFAAAREALDAAGVRGLDSRTLLHLGTSLEIFDLNKVICGGRPDFQAVVRRSLAGGPFDCAQGRPERNRMGGPRLQFPLDTAARLLAEVYGRPGESLTNCSACAASAQAIGHSWRAVRDGRCEAAVCGGFDSMINPLGVGGFQMLGALTTDNDRGPSACRPFDAARRGAVLGEGAAVLVLEPLEKARADGKRVFAELCGYGSSMDAFGLSAPDPDGSGAVRAMQAALGEAGIPPEAVSHVNTHGTGTHLNDEVEAAAIRRVFAAWERMPVAAVKSVTGHLIGAAGAVEAGACLMTLTRGLIPPNPSLSKVASGCELMHVTGRAARYDGEYALSNSFGFGGQNAVLVFRRCNGRA
jgi:3-oxoacyl-[acyl-carrier-protein] synthase II